MELASYVYKNLYRFDQQNFEADLILRWALMSPLNPSPDFKALHLAHPVAPTKREGVAGCNRNKNEQFHMGGESQSSRINP